MNKQKALILEDDPQQGMIFSKTLELAGLQVFLDTDGNRYAEIMTREEPALVVLDYHLPFASGADILKDLRDKYGQEVAILIVTADLIFAKELKTTKMEKLLIKPVIPSRLRSEALQMLGLEED